MASYDALCCLVAFYWLCCQEFSVGIIFMIILITVLPFFSALTVRYLTRRFIGEYDSEKGTNCDCYLP